MHRGPEGLRVFDVVWSQDVARTAGLDHQGTNAVQALWLHSMDTVFNGTMEAEL
jgi:hypothetical protein